MSDWINIWLFFYNLNINFYEWQISNIKTSTKLLKPFCRSFSGKWIQFVLNGELQWITETTKIPTCRPFGSLPADSWIWSIVLAGLISGLVSRICLGNWRWNSKWFREGCKWLIFKILNHLLSPLGPDSPPTYQTKSLLQWYLYAQTKESIQNLWRKLK